MKYFRNILIILIVFLIQSSIVPYFSIFGIQPDILLVVIISISFFEGPNYGSVNGFFGGLLQDMLSIRGFGIGMISKTILGYSSGMFERTIFLENRFLVAPAVALVTIISQVLYFLLAFLFGYQTGLNFFGHVLPIAFYNAILGTPVFLIIEKFWNLLNAGQTKEVKIG